MIRAPKRCTRHSSPTSNPTFDFCGAENSIAHKCNNLVSANFLNPTQKFTTLDVSNADDETIVTSNKTIHKQPPNQVSSIAAAAREVFGNPMLQYLNTLTIATELAIADTGATSIFSWREWMLKTSNQQKIH